VDVDVVVKYAVDDVMNVCDGSPPVVRLKARALSNVGH
jgi:hypothetical protein